MNAREPKKWKDTDDIKHAHKISSNTQYVDLGFSNRIALWEFFSDKCVNNYTSG